MITALGVLTPDRTVYWQAPAGGGSAAGAGVVELAEVARQPVRRHPVTIEPGEHIAAVEVIFAGRGALGQLACEVGMQGSDGGAVQVEDPLAMC